MLQRRRMWVAAAGLLGVGALLCGCGRVGFELQKLQDVGGGNSTLGSSDGIGVWINGDGGLPDAATAVQPGSGGSSSGGSSPVSGGMVAAGRLDAGPVTDAGGAPDAALGDCDPASYVPDDSCGVGICRTQNQPSRCYVGTEFACLPAAPLSSDDATCDAVDDNCNGSADEDFPARLTACGLGACAAFGMITCQLGSEVDSCVPGSPVSSTDGTCDGVDDDCDGQPDDDYAPRATSCGAGACAAVGMVTCQSGSEVDSCVAGSPLGSNDSTCDGVDDDCDGQVDEDFLQTATSCGQGVCAAGGMRVCQSGRVVDTCTPQLPNSTLDDASGGGNGLDDDCDGQVDEDIPCDTSARTFGPGSHSGLAVPTNCSRVRVRLWGGGGAAGGGSAGGDGGPGGFADSTLTINGSIDVWVGRAGSGCTAAGSNAGSANFAGGAGGGVDANGIDGRDGAVPGGGSGGSPSSAGDGGRGYYGGGGGGGGSGSLLASGAQGGGAGAATVMRMNGVVSVVAGGGGGGGGSALFGLLVYDGGNGGGGCSRNGGAPSSAGGGGGGGGTCVSASSQASTTRTPPGSGSIPNGYAVGGGGTCGIGGDGYAIVNFLQ